LQQLVGCSIVGNFKYLVQGSAIWNSSFEILAHLEMSGLTVTALFKFA